MHCSCFVSSITSSKGHPLVLRATRRKTLSTDSHHSYKTQYCTFFCLHCLVVMCKLFQRKSCPMQEAILVLGHCSTVANPGIGSSSGVCNVTGHLLPADHHAHGAGCGNYCPCTLSTIRGGPLAKHAGQHFKAATHMLPHTPQLLS